MRYLRFYSEVHHARLRHQSKGTIRDLALKRIIIHQEKDGMPITALREIKILKALDHPNIVKVLDIVVMPSKFFYWHHGMC
jgi:serine/threonine-protein kinase BUR1